MLARSALLGAQISVFKEVGAGHNGMCGNVTACSGSASGGCCNSSGEYPSRSKPSPTGSGNPILDLPYTGRCIYIFVNFTIDLNHPIHLKPMGPCVGYRSGHLHMLVVRYGQFAALWQLTRSEFRHPKILKSDTAELPAAGLLFTALETVDPDAWLPHRLINTPMKFALQLNKGQRTIEDTWKDPCARAHIRRSVLPRKTPSNTMLGFERLRSSPILFRIHLVAFRTSASLF